MKNARFHHLSGTAALFGAFLASAACGSKAASELAGGDDQGIPSGNDAGDGSGGGGDDSGTFSSIGGPQSPDAGAIPPTQTLVDDCTTGAPGGLSAAGVTAVLAGSSSGAMRFLYPYAQTIFPRGLISPTIMWDGASADYVYVHLKSSAFEYKGCLVPTAAGQILLPQNIWEAASSHTAGAADPFTLSLTTIASGTVTGPISEPIVIAAATLKGSIYYNSYTTKLNSNGGGGAVLRIVPGQNTQLFLGASGCNGCHAVSANGSRMVSDPYNALNMGAGATYALTATTSSNPSPLVSSAPNATFVGVYPDGSLYLGNAHPDDGFGGPRSGGPGSTGPANAALYETDTGNVVSGTNIPTGAMMPMFSPDGTLLAFTDTAIGNGSGQGLATMTFDEGSRTASSYKKLYQVSDSSTYPGWPFFLPDNGGIVFAVGNQSDFSGAGLGLGLTGSLSTATSDVYLVDVASGATTMLAEAMGFASAADAASGTTYLPYSPSDELHHNFYPTVSPIAAGGYFWIFFDSYRHYGNQGLVRQLWGTALTVSANGKYAGDPSHPPFFVTGQELGTGNHRAFTALDPCKANGSTCSEGEDCCGGFCTDGICGQPPACSAIDDACSATQPCCDAVPCIGGYCATIIK